LGKRKRPGGLWLNSHLLPPLPPDPEQGRGRPHGGRLAGVPAGDPGHGDGREMGQNGEDGKGVRFPYLIWS
jgi:hypothetical protein